MRPSADPRVFDTVMGTFRTTPPHPRGWTSVRFLRSERLHESRRTVAGRRRASAFESPLCAVPLKMHGFALPTPRNVGASGARTGGALSPGSAAARSLRRRQKRPDLAVAPLSALARAMRLIVGGVPLYEALGKVCAEAVEVVAARLRRGLHPRRRRERVPPCGGARRCCWKGSANACGPRPAARTADDPRRGHRPRPRVPRDPGDARGALGAVRPRAAR